MSAALGASVSSVALVTVTIRVRGGVVATGISFG